MRQATNIKQSIFNSFLLLKLVSGKTVLTLKIVLTFQLPYSGANSGAI